MIEFVKGQWYQKETTKEYYQCIDKEQWLYNETTKEYRQIIDIKHSVLMVCRRAGQDTHIVAVGDANDYTPVSLNPDFSKAKEGDECWMYGIGETGINSIGDDYVTVWDDENKYVFDKSGYLYFIEEYIADAYTQGVSCGFEESPMLFNSFAQFQAYSAEQEQEEG